MSSNLFGIPQLGGGGGAIEYATISPTLQTNLNANPPQFRNVVLNPATLISNIAGLAATVDEFTNIPQGVYRIVANLFCNSGTQRFNLFVRPRINTAVVTPTSACGYIRSFSGNNSSSFHLDTIMTLPNPLNTVGFSAAREAGNGGSSTSAGDSEFSLMRLE